MKSVASFLVLMLYGIATFPGKPATAETVTIAALGDSLTQGYGLEQGRGFVPQLQAWLEAEGLDAHVINAGVSGDTSAGGASRVAWTLTDEVDAMIVALGGNDLLRGIAPEVTRANITTILEEAATRDVQVLLIGLEAPANYGPEFKAAFDRIWPELAESYATVYAPSFFDGMRSEDGQSIGDLQQYFQSDGIHPNAEGVRLIVQGLGPDVAKLVQKAGATAPSDSP